MRVIICGGRDYLLCEYDLDCLNQLHERYKFTEVVHGGATGVDQEAGTWAATKEIPVKVFLPDWKAFGRAAGPYRNWDMAQYIGDEGLVIAFPGGRGTENMKKIARNRGITIIETNFLGDADPRFGG